jgi:hypothetical protein
MSKWFRMMLFVLAGMAVLFGTQGAKAQIPNPGFEDWSGGEPVDWFTDNVAPAFVFVSQSTAAHSGSSAAQGSVLSLSGFATSPFLLAGADGSGFPINSQVEALHGFYTFAPAGGDIFSVSVVLFKNGAGVGTGGAQLGASSTYKEFVANITHLTSDVPDTAFIEILVLGTGGTVHVGSTFTVDDLAWGAGANDVKQSDIRVPTEFRLEQNYPNPFNPTTVITYQLPTANRVTLRIYDLLGKEVATLVDEEKPAGSYTVGFDATRLTSGMYFYRLTAGSQVQTRTMLLVR